MCTVSFVSVSGGYCITSNRDEQVSRPALAPSNYTVNNKILTYPKDPRAGGTWFAADGQGNVIVLLNGAREKHEWKPPYRRSRGLIVLDLLGANDCLDSWQQIDLENIEPFTIVLFFNQHLYQLQWDGADKSLTELDISKPHIWSSSTLYPVEIRKARRNWFDKFLEGKPSPAPADLFNFHRCTESSDNTNGLIINRNDILQTLSITQAVVRGNQVAINYSDLINAPQSQTEKPIH